MLRRRRPGQCDAANRFDAQATATAAFEQ